MTAKYDDHDGRLRGRRLQARRLKMWTAAQGRCAQCGKLTDYPNGFEVDHKVPLVQGGKDAEENLQVLCGGYAGCHAKKTLSESHGDPAVSFYPEWLEPSSTHLTIVFGPPGSGKSTYVQEHAGSGDLVIDLDLIAAELSGLPIYQADVSWLRKAAHFRNRMLASLREPSSNAAWFITTGAGKDRDWWISKLCPANVVVLDTDQQTCKDRVISDLRRPVAVKDRHISEIDKWWLAERSGVHVSGRRQLVGIDGWPE